MGADFKEKARKTFEKCWDKAAVEANTPDLFSKTPDRAASRYEAEALGDANLAVGDTVAVRMEGGKLVGRRGVSAVLEVCSPSQSLVESVAKGCNIARADIVAVDPISGVLEVSFS